MASLSVRSFVFSFCQESIQVFRSCILSRKLNIPKRALNYIAFFMMSLLENNEFSRGGQNQATHPL